MTKTNWVQRVMTKLGLSEEAKLNLFEEQCIKQWSSQVAKRQVEIDNYEKKKNEIIDEQKALVVELESDLLDLSVSVLPEDVKSKELRDKFFTDFNSKMDNLILKIKEANDKIESTTTQTNEKIGIIKEEISVFEKKINLLS